METPGASATSSQAPADSVSALLGDLHHISQAIKSIPWERQLQEAQRKEAAAEPSDRWTFSRLFRPCTCLCGMPCHSSEWRELGGSEMDVKVQAASCKCVCELLFLLSDSFLPLGRAYTEDGQFNRALNAVQFACLTRNSSLHYSGAFSHEEELRKLKDDRDPKAAEFAWRMRRLTPPPKEALFPKGTLFESQAWILAGDAYVEAQRTFDDSDGVIPHQEGEELEMSKEDEEEVYRVVRSCKCFKISILMRVMDYPLPRIVENKWEKNLSAAAYCYSKALLLSDHNYTLDSEDSESEYTEDENSEKEGSAFTKIAYRKMGFVCHECGRRLAELGWHAKDETDKYFLRAINAFYRGKDAPNFELALCSRIEYHRKLAEFRETHQGPEGRIETMEEAREEYEEALDLCGEAKRRLKKWGDGLDKVDTEEAHTYLNLGKLLMGMDKFYYKQEEPIRKGRKSAEEAIHDAIDLYEKLKCEQKVAYSEYQLGCVLRDRLLFVSVKKEVLRLQTTVTRIWQRASMYYHGVRDTDMFLRIRMEHADMHRALQLKVHTNEGLDEVLEQLLEVCRMKIFNGSPMSKEFILKLMELLKTMCTAAKSQHNIESSSSPSKANDFKLLKEMYGCALKLEGNDYSRLHRMWHNHATMKS